MGMGVLDVELGSPSGRPLTHGDPSPSFALSAVSATITYVRGVWASEFAGTYCYSSCACGAPAY